MEEWIKTISPLIGVAFGWILAESGKIFTDKRLEKRKLKKLLFFLLELRFHFSKELRLDNYLVILENKLISKLKIINNAADFNLESEIWKPLIKELISKSLVQDDKFEYLADNIDKILIELAEIFPILAYELNGQHNIKERINNVDSFINETKSMTDEIPFDIKQWINPKLTKELLANLDLSIKKISKKIDRRTWQMAESHIKNITSDDIDQDLDNWMNGYIDEIIENISEK